MPEAAAVAVGRVAMGEEPAGGRRSFGGLAGAALWLGRLPGWRRAGAALLLGLAAAAAMPPFNAVPLLVPSFTGLMWLVDGAATRRRAFLDGWLWGMGFFVPSLYWIAESMFVDIAQFWWMVPFCVLGLPAYVALYGGGATVLAAGLRPGALRILGFAAWWTIGEWLRGHLFTGFPWLLAGYAWSGDGAALIAPLQAASVVGIYGLSFLTVLAAALPALLGRSGVRRASLVPLGLALGGFVVILGWGLYRLGPGPDPLVPDARIRILSTDLPHRARFTWDDAAADFRRVLALARSPGLDHVVAEVWPEGEIAFPLNQDAGARAAVAAAAPPGGLVITGNERDEGTGPTERAWNSVVVVSADGRILASYDKHHLVPVGEYVPLHALLSFSDIVASRFDFSTGPGPETLLLPGLPAVAPIICYEAVFPHDVVDEAHRPGWMVNVSDDGWFGRSIGPAQHFAIARVRAVEEGLPLVRATNGGIAGLIDAHGRRVATLPFGATAVLDVDLPQALPEAPPYARYGDLFTFALVVLALAPGLVQIVRRR